MCEQSRRRDGTQYKAVCWVNQESVRQDVLTAIGRICGDDVQQQLQQERQDSVLWKVLMSRLQDKCDRQWAVVIDNVEQSLRAIGVMDALNDASHSGHIFVTTKNKAVINECRDMSVVEVPITHLFVLIACK